MVSHTNIKNNQNQPTNPSVHQNNQQWNPFIPPRNQPNIHSFNHPSNQPTNQLTIQQKTSNQTKQPMKRPASSQTSVPENKPTISANDIHHKYSPLMSVDQQRSIIT